jgi:hypothetical protein
MKVPQNFLHEMPSSSVTTELLQFTGVNLTGVDNETMAPLSFPTSAAGFGFISSPSAALTTKLADYETASVFANVVGI